MTVSLHRHHDYDADDNPIDHGVRSYEFVVRTIATVPTLAHCAFWTCELAQLGDHTEEVTQRCRLPVTAEVQSCCEPDPAAHLGCA